MGIEDLFSGPDGMKNLMAQAQQMQEQMKEAQARALEVEVTGESGGDLLNELHSCAMASFDRPREDVLRFHILDNSPRSRPQSGAGS